MHILIYSLNYLNSLHYIYIYYLILFYSKNHPLEGRISFYGKEHCKYCYTRGDGYRKFKGKLTYVAFLDLKKAYDSVPIFNIFKKIFHLGISDKCFDFISKLYLTSKARARYFVIK